MSFEVLIFGMCNIRLVTFLKLWVLWEIRDGMKFFIDMQNQYEYQFKLNPPVQWLDIFMVVLKFYQ